MQSNYKERSGSWYRHKCHIEPLTGFPWNGRFSSFEELKVYFDKDKLTCLLCGREYIGLGNHISVGHEITMDEYKAQFGIPWTYGLAGKGFREQTSRRLTKLRKQGIIPYSPSSEHIKKLKKSLLKRRPAVDASRNDSRNKVLELHGRKEKWQPDDFNEYLRRVASGRTLTEVSCDEDMPHHTTFLKYIAENHHFKKKYEKIWNGLPYSVKVRANKLDEKFEHDLIKLRRKGLALTDIAAKLNVKTAAVRQRWHTLKKKGKLKPFDIALERIRRPAGDYEEYLRRIKSGRFPSAVGRDKDMPSYTSFIYHLKKNSDLRKRYEKTH
jgi:DNA-binding NarL/FixJ family response regulator